MLTISQQAAVIARCLVNAPKESELDTSDIPIETDFSEWRTANGAPVPPVAPPLPEVLAALEHLGQVKPVLSGGVV